MVVVVVVAVVVVGDEVVPVAMIQIIGRVLTVALSDDHIQRD